MKKIKFFLFLFGIIATAFSFESLYASPLCGVGDRAQVHWGNRWWKASVIGVNDTGDRCLIHYTGWGNSWNEWVGSDRIRITSSARNPVNPGTYVPSPSAFGVGSSVQVRWGGKWWPAHVLNVSGNRLRIQYDGYDHSWDEWVGPNRYRAP